MAQHQLRSALVVVVVAAAPWAGCTSSNPAAIGPDARVDAGGRSDRGPFSFTDSASIGPARDGGRDARGGVDAAPAPASCTDHLKNGTETDVDCGGGCSTKCDAGQGCAGNGDCASARCNRAKRCAPTCGGLNLEITDAWAERWDGTERGLATWAAAHQACAALGGRLPTATELFRVSAPQSGGVGESDRTNALWALNPSGPGAQITVRLSDGVAGTAPVGETRHYRCICPDSLVRAFDQEACHGPPDAPCAALPTEGGRNHVDKADRATLPLAAALWECTYYRAHLPQALTLIEAARSGVERSEANANSAWLLTADSVNYQGSVVLKWSGSGASWSPISGSNLSWSYFYTPRPFRCVGPGYAAGTHPATVANEFVGPRSSYKGETVDSANAAWHLAHTTCWQRGGHLPRTAELAELVQEGLPGGTNAWNWTSDQTGYVASGPQFLASILRWTGTAPSFPYAHPDVLTWAWKTDPNHAHRCIYYPIDQGYAGPQQCLGGCFAATLPGTSGAKLWFDQFDRSAATFNESVATCLAAHGHLPSARDLVEGIRAGLPNGNGLATGWLRTADFGVGEATDRYDRTIVVKWSGTGGDSYKDQYPTDMTWAPTDAAHLYRCMWTNELR